MRIRNILALMGTGLGLYFATNEYKKRRNALDLHGKVVLITGDSRGLGLAMAHAFAEEGARLVICAREQEALELARVKLASSGTEVLAVPCDITDRAQVQRLIDQTIAHFGQIDVLVNNAGIITVGPMQTMTLHDYEEAMNIMFWGALSTTLAVLPHMLERKEGRIVNITSTGGKVSVPHLLPYSSAKFAVLGFSEGLHAELEKEGIKVITIVPGLMRTGSHINAFVKGHRTLEYTLFGLMGTLPLTSMNVSRAARQIVLATRRGDAEVILTIQAQLLTRFHGLLPGLTSDILALINRTLPGPKGTSTARSLGRNSRSPASTLLTGLGEPAAHEYNQYAKRG